MPIPDPVTLDAATPQFFAEAAAYFRKQAPWISGSSWETIADLSAKKGDEVSGAAMLSMVDDVWKRMDRAVAEGIPYSEFVREIGASLKRDWVGVDSPRLRLIYHNNVGSALMAGRMAQVLDPDVVADRPYLLFDAIEDMRTSEICLERDGVVLPADHPFWKSSTPLLHHNCRSSVISLDPEDADELGGVTPPGKLRGIVSAQAGWGNPHSWEDWRPEASDYTPALFREYERWRDGEEYARELDAWRQSLRDAQEEGVWIDAESALRPVDVSLPPQRVMDDVRYYLDQWVVGSKRRASVTLKKAAIDELGLQGIVAYSRVNWNIPQEDVDAARSAVRVMYDDTQEALRRRGVTSVTVYRGVKSGYAVRGALESYTTDVKLAQRFNGGAQGGVEVLTVPASRILAFSGGPNWQNGKYGEQHEYIVLGSDVSP